MRPFSDRKPSALARDAMVEASENQSKEFQTETIESCKEALSKTTRHDQAEITGRGGEAIGMVLSALGGGIMFPDQGIWGGAPKHCEGRGITHFYLKTNLGLIEPEALKKAIEDNQPKALLITSFAGYIAEQDVRELSMICRERGVILIEDVSASIGDRILADGRFADVIVGSVRTPKLLNLPSGGFITSNNRGFMERIREHTKQFKPNPVMCAGITAELKHAQNTIDNLEGVSESLKIQLDGVIHRGKRGLCVGLLHDEEPKRLAKKARGDGLVTITGRSLLSTCPRYDRFLESGAVVELKKLDPKSIGEAELKYISETISSE
jgi:aspartate aminotransferase-like enzyme